MEYTIKIFPDPEGDDDYIAEIEELKGCSAFGETPEQALKEIEIAMKLWIETAKNTENQFQCQREKEQTNRKNVLTLCFLSHSCKMWMNFEANME